MFAGIPATSLPPSVPSPSSPSYCSFTRRTVWLRVREGMRKGAGGRDSSREEDHVEYPSREREREPPRCLDLHDLHVAPTQPISPPHHLCLTLRQPSAPCQTIPHFKERHLCGPPPCPAPPRRLEPRVGSPRLGTLSQSPGRGLGPVPGHAPAPAGLHERVRAYGVHRQPPPPPHNPPPPYSDPETLRFAMPRPRLFDSFRH